MTLEVSYSASWKYGNGAVKIDLEEGEEYAKAGRLTYLTTNSARVKVGWLRKSNKLLDFFIFIDEGCVGRVTFEPYDFRYAELVALFGVRKDQIYSPHVSMHRDYRGLGYPSFVYQKALNSGLMLVTDGHSLDASQLWDRLATKPGINSYFVCDGQIVSEPDQDTERVLTKLKPKMKTLHTAIRAVVAAVQDEIAKINVTKPYKRRILKMDPIHRLARQVNKLKSKLPQEKRKREVYRKKYKLKNKMALQRRSKFVREAKKRMSKPVGPKPHRSTSAKSERQEAKFFTAQELREAGQRYEEEHPDWRDHDLGWQDRLRLYRSSDV